jgi:hypothetical protein
MAETDDTALSPHYYRDNYLRLCDTVEAQYGDILTGAERAALLSFRLLDFKAQCLYVRLVSRTGPWFRESKLAYNELGAIAPILDTLLAQDMAEEAADLSAQELGWLFTQSELRQIFPDLDYRQIRTKATLVATIDQLQLSASMTHRAIGAVEEQRIVAPLAVELAQNLQVLFFGNRHQNLTDFVLQDLGVTHYYPYALDREHRLFTCRDAFDEYLNCAAVSDSYHERRDAGEWEQLPALALQMLDTTIAFLSSERHWQRLCNNVSRDLERLHEHGLALRLYECSLRHPARERRARILETLGDNRGAVAVCAEILSDPWSEEEREAAGRILPRVQRKLDGSRVPRQRDAFSTVTLALPGGSGPVEEQVANHLAGQWQSVHYVENKLMNALFGLAFWEQIFAAVPGVFHNPYQSVPTDMYDNAFRARRRASIVARLDELRGQDLVATLCAAHQRYCNYQCRWVDWRRIDAALVEASARIVPAAHLLAIWERMLFDPGENRRGFPDLIALGTGAGDYCLIEVKGPGDALQNSQKRWLRFFQAQSIPAQVAWVQWSDD